MTASALTLREWWLNQQRTECIDEEQWLQEYCCVPADESSAFITYEMITAAEDDSVRRTLAELAALHPKNASLFIGMDVARKVDLTVIDVEERLGDVFYERLRVEMRGKTFTEQESELYRILALPAVKRACLDATGLGAQLAERARERFGWKVEPVTFTNQVKEDLAYPLRAAHEDRKIRYAHDEQLRADLRGIKKETTLAGNVRFVGESADSHCDRFWGKALALHAGKPGKGNYWGAII